MGQSQSSQSSQSRARGQRKGQRQGQRQRISEGLSGVTRDARMTTPLQGRDGCLVGLFMNKGFQGFMDFRLHSASKG
jgi:hypothetical protein